MTINYVGPHICNFSIITMLYFYLTFRCKVKDIYLNRILEFQKAWKCTLYSFVSLIVPVEVLPVSMI